jgi:putative dehydrogenase
MNVTVIGLGAMGGGMARSILRCPKVDIVSGYDLSSDAVTKFHGEAVTAKKAITTDTPMAPFKLSDFVTKDTDVVVIVLVNEAQCNSVCFGGENGENLLSLMKPNSCVFLCSTVTPAFAKSAYEKFAAAGSDKSIQFVDSPMSGGPVRALSGELTMMVAAEPKTLTYVDPLLQAMGKEIHIIPGGPGMGSTVKMVHQLLAGVHIVVAAEALALAAKAGVDVKQMYDIVKGAAGSSWMFCDRGQRMFDNEDDKVMSALGIFIKDLDIVYSESKRLQCPTPIASAALQQFISGSSMGLARKDDSQVVKVYETITGVPLTKKGDDDKKKRKVVDIASKKEGDDVGDLWDGEEILEVGSEPRHLLALSNDYTRVLKVKFGPEDTTFAHKHAEDSLYFFLVEDGLDIVNHVKGSDPQCDCLVS